MTAKPGYCLTSWSDQFSSWIDVCASEDRAKVVAMAGRLVLLGIDCRIVFSKSISDDDVEAALMELPPPGRAFVAHPRGDANA